MSYRPKHCEMFSFNTEIFALKSSCKHPLEIYVIRIYFAILVFHLSNKNHEKRGRNKENEILYMERIQGGKEHGFREVKR